MFVKCRISTLHTSKSAANSCGQGLEFTAVPLTGKGIFKSNALFPLGREKSSLFTRLKIDNFQKSLVFLEKGRGILEKI